MSNTQHGDYWKTQQGIMERIRIFAGLLLVQAYNDTLTAAASDYGAVYLQMQGPPPKCPYCIQYYGKIYRIGEYLPEFPAHPNCPHVWEVVT